MRAITRAQLDRFTDDIARLHATLQDRPAAWHAIQVMNSATGNTTPASNPNSSGAEQCNCIDGTNCPHGTPTEKAALTFDPDLLADHRALATLQRLMRDAVMGTDSIKARSGTPRPLKCPTCMTGEIPVGRTRCSNEDCRTHANTRTQCTQPGDDGQPCGQYLVTGATGKAKPHKHPDTGELICDKHLKRIKRDNRYKRERGTGTIGLGLDNNTITGEDAA